MEYVSKIEEKVNELNKEEGDYTWSCRDVEKAIFCNTKIEN